MEGITAYAAEIPVGGENETEKHLYEEVVYVSGKRNDSALGPGEGANSSTAEGVSLPCVKRARISTREEPVFFLAVTTAPYLRSFPHGKFVQAVTLSLRIAMPESQLFL